MPNIDWLFFGGQHSYLKVCGISGYQTSALCRDWLDIHTGVITFVVVDYIHCSDASRLWTYGNVSTILPRSVCSVVM